MVFKRMLSGNRDVKANFFTTKNYEVLYNWFGKRFVANLAVDLEVIRNRQGNAERAIVFQTIILWRARLVSSAKNISDRIT